MSKLLGGIIGCKDKPSSWHLHGFPNGSYMGSTVYNVGEKPTVILYCTLTLIAMKGYQTKKNVRGARLT